MYGIKEFRYMILFFKRRISMKLKIAFVCVHNSCRSQMAEAWAKELGSEIFEAYSAGTEEYPEVKPLAIKVMEESGISMDGFHPKLLSDIPKAFDIVVTMGCNVNCPFLPAKHREDWGIEDPSGGNIEDHRIARELIKEKMLDLIKRTENGNLNL